MNKKTKKIKPAEPQVLIKDCTFNANADKETLDLFKMMIRTQLVILDRLVMIVPMLEVKQS